MATRRDNTVDLKMKPGEDATPIWSTNCAKAVDRLSIEAGVKSSSLMEAAGKAIADVIKEEYFSTYPVLVLAGPGNNGGDGLVVARHLSTAGYRVSVRLVFASDKVCSKDFQEQLTLLQNQKIDCEQYKTGALAKIKSTEPPIIVDAIFGLGFSGKVEDKVLKGCIEEVNAMPKRALVAVDMPTGMVADAFVQGEDVVKADISVTFGAAKPAHVMSSSRALCGQTVVKKIGFVADVEESEFHKSEVALWQVGRRFLRGSDPRDRLGADVHKFSRGHVLVLGGSEGKTGAPILAAQASLRAGAGWATVAASEAVPNTLPLELTSEDFFAKGVLNTKLLTDFVKRRQVKAMVIGSGAMKNPINETNIEVIADLNHAGLFLVVDAAAIHGLAPLLKKVPFDPNKAIITPHPGEWQKLSEDLEPLLHLNDLKKTIPLLKKWGVSLIYKTATPFVLSPLWNRYAAVAEGGTNSLAKAGSGDVLAGIIAAFGALGEDAPTAALKGQLFLNHSAHALSRTHSSHSITSVDLISGLSLPQM
ncbi:MAG: NAD(P)H-hydrate epimerase [Oligoflexales bacterium]